MIYCVMTEADIDRVVPLYLDYYNSHEDGAWTAQTAYKRIHQVWSHEDGYCLLLEDGGAVIGFAMGHMEQYDDLMAYDLVEIVIAADHQGKGLGAAFMRELEHRVKERGAAMIQLQAVNDEKHEKFYGSLGYYNANNFVLKAKFLGK